MHRITAFLAACLCASIAQADVPPPPTESTVVVIAGEGQGSGFHIGDGIVVTAAHVIEGKTFARIEMSDEKTLLADVIFIDARNDLAFLEVQASILDADDPAAHPGKKMQIARLACRASVLGENVMVRGTPVGLRFISTWGRIAGDARPLFRWSAVVPINISAAPGNSGGPVFDDRGNVIAVLVGIGRASGSQFISLAVPATAVCRARDYLGLNG